MTDADRDIQQQAEIMARVHPDHWTYMAHVLDTLNGPAQPAPPAIPCITADPGEPANPHYRAVCTGTADLMACSVHCADTGCGGHPICRPCYNLGRASGLIP